MSGVPNPTFDAVSAAIAPSSPLGIGHHEVEDIANAVLFIAGNATARMTAEVLDVSYCSIARNIGYSTSRRDDLQRK